MKIRILLCFLTMALAIVPGLRAEDQKDDTTELGSHMQKMSSAFRKLRTMLPDATKNDDSLAQVAIIKDNATAALDLKPAKLASIPDADQAKFVADYQAEIKKLLAALDKLTAALKAGDNDGAQKVYAEIGQIQKDGHGEFKAKKKQ
jgi:soluble cytochrome b562